MSFFKKLFGGNKEEKIITEDVEFTKDFYDAVKRYQCLIEGEVEIEFKDKQGNIIPPSYAFEGAYNEWKQIQSPWDRRSVIYQALDEFYLKNLDKWKILERFTLDRYPDKTLQFAEKFGKEGDYNDAEFLTSLAKAHCVLSEYDKGIEYAEKALSIDSGLRRAKTVYADLLHLSNQHEKAHELYDDLLKTSKLSERKEQSISVLEIVGFFYDIVNSPVYAVSLLNNEESNEELWNEITAEFYYSPYFRAQHAFWLIKNNESLKGIVKLISLSQEFPSYKEGVVNAKSTILQLREQMKDNTIFEKELKYVSQLMEQNKWEA
ncbi:MAG: hypothetical protein U0U67_13630 [Chitinophagales bacterium]